MRCGRYCRASVEGVDLDTSTDEAVGRRHGEAKQSEVIFRACYCCKLKLTAESGVTSGGVAEGGVGWSCAVCVVCGLRERRRVGLSSEPAQR